MPSLHIDLLLHIYIYIYIYIYTYMHTYTTMYIPIYIACTKTGQARENYADPRCLGPYFFRSQKKKQDKPEKTMQIYNLGYALGGKLAVSLSLSLSLPLPPSLPPLSY